MGEYPEQYVRQPGRDFTCPRTLAFETVISLLLTMSENSIGKLLIGRFHNSEQTPSASALRTSQSLCQPPIVYIALGVNLDGRKDVLGMWVSENESAKFWVTVLNSLKNRGIEDSFVDCTDNLTEFDAAIHATFPQIEIQNCIIHQLRNSSKYVSYKDRKALMADRKAAYAGPWMSRPPWMPWPLLRSAGTRNTRKSPNPGGPTGPTSAPASSIPRRCAG